MKLFDILGWFGVIIIVGTYGLLSFNLIESTNPVYQLLNLFGSVGILMEAFSKRDYQPAVLNVIWSLIALIALLRLFI